MVTVMIGNFLPPTARSAEHITSVDLQQFLQRVAEEESFKVDSFKVIAGTAFIDVPDADSVDKIAKHFVGIDNEIVVRAVDPLEVQLVRNRAIKERAARTRTAKDKP